jgi:flagellar motility protein MotE (MotC chaperone)
MSLGFLMALILSTASAQTDGDPAAVNAKAGREALMSRESVESCSADGLRRVAWSLNVREQALERRERLIVQRESDLVRAQEDMQRWIQDLESVRDEISGMLNLHSDSDEKLESLKNMVENMRPKQAALVLAELKPGLAVRVIDQMDEAKAGKAMAVMQPAKAAELAEKLTRPITVGEKK